MKLLLAGLFALFPLIAHAEDLGTFSANEVDPNSVTNELGPYGNPYSPSSATNFEAIAAPPLSDQEGNDQGRLSMSLSNFGSISKSFDRYGIPYSSDSIFQRYGVGNPYRSDCSNNPYGQGWQHRVR